MIATTTTDFNELVDLLERQHERYVRLQRLVSRQRRLVASDEAQSLLALLAERQRLMDELAAVHEQLTPFRRDWTRVYQGLERGTQSRVREILEGTNALLAAVMASDREDAELLGARRQVAAAAMSASRAGARATAAYGAAGATAPRALTEAHA